MVLYIIISLIAVFFAYVSNRNKQKLFLAIAFIIPTVFLAIRYNFGSDYMGYLDYYQTTVQYSLIESLTATRFEPGWSLICKLSQPIGFFGLVIVLTFVEMAIFYYLCVKYVPPRYYWLALFLLLLRPTLMLTFSSMMRQTLAVCFGLLAIDGIIHKKRILPILFIFLATQIHNSAYILIPLILLSFFSDTKKVNYLLIALLILFPVVLYFFSDNLMSAFYLLIETDQFSYYDNYVGRESNISFGLGDVINLFLLLMLFLNNTKFKIEVRMLNVLYTLYIPFLLITYVAPMISRLSYYFIVFQMLCFPNLVSVQKNSSIRTIIVLLIVPYTFYSLYTCYYSEWGHYFHDYITIFSLNRWL